MIKTINLSTLTSSEFERFMKYIESKFIDDVEEFNIAFNMLSPQEQNIFSSKWGLDGTQFCQGFKSLNQKLGIDNSKELYLLADASLSKFYFTKFFISSENIQYDILVSYGCLINDIFDYYVPNKRRLFKKVDFKKFKEQTQKLPNIQYSILQLVYGLDCYALDLQSICQNYGTNRLSILQLVFNCKRTLYRYHANYILP